MKLNKSQKKNAGRNQTQDLYPKVKTFSKAYDYAPKKPENPAVPSGGAHFFALDERPYPTAVPPVSYPEIPNKSSEVSDPERIDLQDTLLTDESFVERPLKQPAAVSGSPAADADENGGIREPEEAKEDSTAEQEEDFWHSEESDLPEAPEESGENDIPEPFYEYEAEEDEAPGPFHKPEPEDSTESPYGSDPEAEYEADSFFDADEDTDSGLETGSEPVLFPGSGSHDEPEEETVEPFSWFDSDSDSISEDSAGIAFKKKKYTAQIGKRKNLRKKLRSKPAGSLKWKSSDTKIAKVSRKGVLKPRKKGKITVRVKAKGGERAKVKIRITSAKKKKPNALPWESVGTEKKSAVSEKKWARFA